MLSLGYKYEVIKYNTPSIETSSFEMPLAARNVSLTSSCVKAFNLLKYLFFKRDGVFSNLFLSMLPKYLSLVTKKNSKSENLTNLLAILTHISFSMDC